MDTISALATALVESGIGIIRLSGKDALPIAEKILKTKSGKLLNIRESHRIRYGFVYDGNEAVDKVLYRGGCGGNQLPRICASSAKDFHFNA